MTRKYTKSKKRISNKRNSKRNSKKRISKRINNKSKKLTKKIQKGGDDKIIKVSENISESLESLGKFGKPDIGKYYKNYNENYVNYTTKTCNSTDPNKKDCKKLKGEYEKNLAI